MFIEEFDRVMCGNVLRHPVHTVDGRLIEIDFTKYTEGDMNEHGNTPDSGQAFIEFDMALTEQLASVCNTAIPRRKEGQ